MKEMLCARALKGAYLAGRNTTHKPAFTCAVSGR
jgi:hypothetical protein